MKDLLVSIFLFFKYFKSNINQRIKNTNWYGRMFPHLSEYNRLEKNADIICIGSTPAKNALDFRPLTNIKGYNLAVCPETIFYDFQVIKNYHSFLKPGGTILFVLCPFTFLKDKYSPEFGSISYQNIRYYPILHRAMIDNFNEDLYTKYVLKPWTINVRAWVSLFIDPPKKVDYDLKNNPDTPTQSKTFCEKRVQGWMREFRMTDLNPTHIPEMTENAIKGNIKIFQDMKEFIEERGYKAYIIIPPFPKEMISLLPSDLVEHNLIEPVKATGIPYISYYGKEEWLSREFYYHGFLLNASGRELFTKDVLSRISL